MKKFIIVGMLLVLLLSNTVYAAQTVQPTLSFSGTTANCSVTIRAKGKAIDATLELWQGSTMVASWHKTGTSSVTISETYNCTSGVTYTLTVTGTIGGQTIIAIPVTGNC